MMNICLNQRNHDGGKGFAKENILLDDLNTPPKQTMEYSVSLLSRNNVCKPMCNLSYSLHS